MKQPEELVKYKRVTHAFYTAYTMSNYGMNLVADDLMKQDGFNFEGRFQIGPADENNDAANRSFGNKQS